MAIQATVKTFQKEVLKADLPVLVDFWAPWCGPCRMLAPVFDEVSKQFLDTVKFVKVNVDESGELAEQYGVQGIPNMIVFHKGKLVGQMVGFMSKQILKEKLEQIVSNLK